MYAETSLHLNSGKKSKCMQEQAYLWTAERKVNVCWKKITFEQRKAKVNVCRGHVYLWTAERKVNLCRNKFTFEQLREKWMYAETSLPLNSGKKGNCMVEQVFLWTAEGIVNLCREEVYLWTAVRKVNVCKNKFTFQQRKEKPMYAGKRLPLNSWKESKCMQEEVYPWTAERKVNVCWNKFTFELRK